jgi:16S rRNA (adenine1518-N6/adenine1519-N6)-dimethyltransferase
MSLGDELIPYEIKFKKRLGQHFLIDKSVLRKLIEYANLNQKDVVLEVGAGVGTLTSPIAEKVKKVIAVEKDSVLASILRKKFSSNNKIELIEGDILKVRLPKFNKIVSTPPYNISSKLLFMLLERKFDLAIMTLQREFAERLVAESGSRNYGRLSVGVGHVASVKILDHVSPKAFHPPPKVSSVIVSIEMKKPSVKVLNEKFFNDLVRELFTQRRRRLRKALTHYLERRYGKRGGELASLIALPEKRVYETTIQEFEAISNELYQLTEGWKN